MHGICASQENVKIPFSLYGVISYIPSRFPTKAELNECPHLRMTEDKEWEPCNEKCAKMRGGIILKSSSGNVDNPRSVSSIVAALNPQDLEANFTRRPL